VVEIELVQPITPSGPQHHALAQVVETEVAQQVTVRKIETVGQTTETEIAQPISRRKIVILGQAVEIELAQSVSAFSPALGPPGTIGDLRPDLTGAGGPAGTRSVGGSTGVGRALGGSVGHTVDRSIPGKVQ
jgi:hypothetical protein